MAAPSLAEANTQLKNGVKPFTDLNTIFATIVSSIDTAEQAFEGDFLPGGVESALSRLRGDLSIAYGPDRHRLVWDAWGREVLRVAGLPESDMSAEATWARIHRYLHEQSATFNDRNFTRGTPAAVGGGTGNGTCVRLTVDWESYNLQGGHVETKRFECIQDQNTGALRGDERFQVRGEDAAKDAVDYQGSGILSVIGCMNAGTGTYGSQLANSSWDATFSGSGVDKIPSWTIAGTAAKVTAATSSNIYVRAPGVTLASSNALAFATDGAATNSVEQALDVRRLTAYGERVPWMLEVGYAKTNSGATGTLVLTIGNKTTTLDLSGIGDTNWHKMQFTVDKNVYYRNWQVDSPVVKVAVTNLSAGSLYVDSCVFAPWARIDGTFWWLSGGSTPFLLRDAFTAADSGPTVATSEMMASASWARLPVSLPTNNAGAETITDP